MKSKINEVGLKLGQKICRWTIIDENLIKYCNRKQVKVQCECGNISLRRHDYLRKGKTMGCETCVHRNEYTKRKSPVKFYKGLRHTFLTKLNYKDNLYRGSKIIKCNLTIEDLYNQLEKQNFKCTLSGVKLKILDTNNDWETNASIDRIDSNKDYTVDNIQWVHKYVNKIKNSFSQECFISICNYVAKTNPIYDNFEPSWVNTYNSNSEGATTNG